MKGNKVLVTLLVLVNIALGSWIIIKERTGNRKLGYIIIREVFLDFNMKKELETKYKKTQSARQKILDSLAFEIKLMDKNLQTKKDVKAEDVNPLKVKEEEFIQKKKQFLEDDAAMNQQYDKQIIEQLNQYVRDFGKEKGYDYILGNDANGSLMYAREGDNLTKEVIQYVNEKYEGRR